MRAYSARAWPFGLALLLILPSAARAEQACLAFARAVAATHPERAARDASQASAAARAEAMGALPAPMATLEVWDFPLGEPSRAGREGMYMVGLRQLIPPPGSRSALSHAAEAEAEAELARGDERLRALEEEVGLTCLARATLAARAERLGALRALAKATRDALQAGLSTSGGLALLGRAEVEEVRAERLELDARGALAPLDAALDAWASLTDQPAPKLTLGPELETVTTTRADPTTRLARAESHAAELRARAAEARANVPGFELSATIMQMPSARVGAGVMVGVELPWLWGPGDDEARAARAEALAAEHRALSMGLTRTRTRAVLRAERASQDAALLRLVERELPALRRAAALARAELSGGRFELGAWLEASRQEAEADLERIALTGARAELDLRLALLGEIDP